MKICKMRSQIIYLIHLIKQKSYHQDLKINFQIMSQTKYNRRKSKFLFLKLVSKRENLKNPRTKME